MNPTEVKFLVEKFGLERRRVKFICHLLRHNEFLTNIIEGKVLGKRGRGRTKKSYLEDIYIY